VNVSGHNFAYVSAFVGYMFVEFGHYVVTAVYGGRGAVLFQLRDAVATEPGHVVLVNDFGARSVVVVVGGREERLEVRYQKERDGLLLFNVGKFQLAIFGVGVSYLLRSVFQTEGNVVFEGGRGGKRVEAAVTHVSSAFMFGPVCH